MAGSTSTSSSVLRHLDVRAIRVAARAESRSRQVHLPPISVYRWWARRTEAVTGAIVDAISIDDPGRRLLIADPFAGGGVIALAALLRGHRVYAQDVNPWAARGLATMLDLPDPADLASAADRLHTSAAQLLRRAYATTLSDGSPGLIAHTMRVATVPCPGCSRKLRLFPSALVSLLNRVESGNTTGFVACAVGHLNLASAAKGSLCKTCRRRIRPDARYTAGREATCAYCGWTGKVSNLSRRSGFSWRVVLVERVGYGVREIAVPTRAEIRAADASSWRPTRQLPAITAGVETAALTNHGMHYWHDLFPARQRVVLESLLTSCEEAAAGDQRVARALEAAVIGSAEMAGFASRWDARYLKAYEAVANHRLNFTTFAVEPNVWGAHDVGRGTVERRLAFMAKAALWLDERIGFHLEVEGPKVADSRRSPMAASLDARVVVGSSSRICIPEGHLDAIVTDPPYHDDVHYCELSALFRAWAGESTGALEGDAIVDRSSAVATTDAYMEMLTDTFAEMRRALRPGGHLILSYANREPSAWVALFSALQQAGFEGIGYTVVHSENETDHAKAGRRACNLDVLIDLVPAAARRMRGYQPTATRSGDEEAFCRIVGRSALSIGRLRPGWDQGFVESLRQCAFIA